MGEIKYYIGILGGSNSIADLADAFRGGGGLGKDTNGILEYVHSITGDALTLSATGGWGLELFLGSMKLPQRHQKPLGRTPVLMPS